MEHSKGHYYYADIFSARVTFKTLTNTLAYHRLAQTVDLREEKRFIVQARGAWIGGVAVRGVTAKKKLGPPFLFFPLISIMNTCNAKPSVGPKRP